MYDGNDKNLKTAFIHRESIARVSVSRVNQFMNTITPLHNCGTQQHVSRRYDFMEKRSTGKSRATGRA